MLKIYSKDVDSNGKIDHINIEQYTIIDCSNCENLTSLPLWPNITKVNCSNCENLTTLPLWPNITKVNCSNCKNLTTLPLWANIIEVNCSNCENLTMPPPPWPNVLKVSYDGCYNWYNYYEFIHLWPKIKEIKCDEAHISSFAVEKSKNKISKEKRNYMYLLQEREFIRSEQPVYKMGITKTLYNRMGQYPKGSIIICVMPIDGDPETLCLHRFREIFIARTDIGSEYFQGNIDEMVKLLIKCCTA